MFQYYNFLYVVTASILFTTDIYNNLIVQLGAVGLTLALLIWFSRKMILSSEKDKERDNVEKNKIIEGFKDQIKQLQANHNEQITKTLDTHELIVNKLIEHNKELIIMFFNNKNK